MVLSRRVVRLLLAALAASALCGSPVAAQGPAPDGQRPPGWQTWTWGDQCFAVLFPERESVASLQKDGAYLAIKHMPLEETFDSVAIVSGRAAEKGLVGRIEIDDVSYDLLMFSGTGFVSSGSREQALLKALSDGTKAVVTWTTPDALIVQNYDLVGIGRARKIIDYACKENGPKPPAPKS